MFKQQQKCPKIPGFLSFQEKKEVKKMKNNKRRKVTLKKECNYIFLKSKKRKRNIAYIRVSTIDQNVDRQIEELKKYHIDLWYVEKVSGKNTERPELQKMLKKMRPGDTVYIIDFSRLARSTSDLLNLVDKISAAGVNLVSIKENFDTGTPAGKLMLTVFAAIYEFERTNMLERQREGIEIAKKENKYADCGRKKKELTPEQFNHVRQWEAGNISKKELAEILGASRPTLNRILNDLKLTSAECSV